MEEFKTIVSYKDNILNYSKDNVLKAIHVLEKFMPPDDYIITYKDFLEKRNLIRYTCFNIKVFNALVSLTLDIWNTEKKINRLSLLTAIKRYSKKNPFPGKISPETASKLFELFRQVVFFQNIKKNIKTFDKMRKLVNSLMLEIYLKDEELAWLCDNAETSGIILNRVLRYKYKSPVITKWVKDNFHVDYLRLRRAELTGWLLDENPAYEISTDILFDDFEYANALDINILNKYENDLLEYNQEMEDRKKSGKIPLWDSINPFDPLGGVFDFSIPDDTPVSPVLILTNRNYDGYIDFEKGNFRQIKRDKEFKEYRQLFVRSIDVVLKSVMIWGIAYSRIENKAKAKLLEKYYTPKFNNAYFKIAMKDKNLELFKWMHKNAN